MKRFRSKVIVPALNIVVAFLVVWGVHYGAVARAEEKPLAKINRPPEKVHITADRLEADDQAGYAEFIGHVVAIQGNAKIESDRLKIYYKRDVDKGKEAKTTEDYIDKIVARGNVRIMLDERVAYTDQAVYMADTGIFILTGPQTRVTSGKNFITGDKITVHRYDSRISVAGNPNKRVEAVFYSQEGGAGKKTAE